MDRTHHKNVIIIGSGFGGLASACLLAKKGYTVTIFEKNELPGGRANIFTTPEGFVFDMGPSWYMMPDVFNHFFSLFDINIEKELSLQRLSPSYRVFLKSDQSHYDFYSDMEKNVALFETIEPGSGAVLRRFIEGTALQYAIAKNDFMFKNYDSILDFFTWKVAKAGIKLPLLAKQKTIIEKRFKSEILRKVLQYQTVLLGTAPGDTPGIYSLMNYVDFELGVWYPHKGIYTIIELLVRTAKQYGVTIHTNSPVEKIIVTDKKATGVMLEDKTIHHADIVISNADIVHTDMQLLPKENKMHTPKYWDTRTLAPSAFMLYLGVKGTLPKAVHHNLVFSKNWDATFDSIFKTAEWPADPSLYICVPSKTDTTVAPENHENLFVLVPIAPGLTADEAFLKKYKQQVINEIATAFDAPDLAERIVYERQYWVPDFIKDYNAYKGTALGLAHTLRQTAILRPNNVHPNIANLFFVGAGVNPGIGMPICLISAELAYKRIEGITHPHALVKEELE